MDKTEQLKEKIQEADFVLIGIGEEFAEKFEKISEHIVLTQMLEQVEGNETLEWVIPFLEKIYINEQKDSETVAALRKLYELVQDKNYFIVTTCIDGNVRNAGFDLEKIVEPCGNYDLLQCGMGCSEELYESGEYINKIKQTLKNGELSFLERPVCPLCGAPLTFNNILSAKYIEKGYLPQWEKYTKWLQFTLNKKVCILELGVGMNLPSVIRWPFEKIAFYNQKSSFFRINETVYQMTEEIGGKGISIEGNAKEFLENM